MVSFTSIQAVIIMSPYTHMYINFPYTNTFYIHEDLNR